MISSSLNDVENVVPNDEVLQCRPSGNNVQKLRREDTPASLMFTSISVADERRLITAFEARKKSILKEIELHSAQCPDKSVKGFIDEKCIAICELLNTHRDYVTTSSCSGRISIFHGIDDEPNREMIVSESQKEIDVLEEPADKFSSTASMKRGVDGSLGWIMVSHDHPLTEDQVNAIISHTVITTTLHSSIPQRGTVSYKVEPFVLHVQCRTIGAAKQLLSAALEAGFRNSGVIPPGKNIMVAVRHAGLSLDVPLVFDGGLTTATEEYIHQLVRLGEAKMVENEKRILKFEQCFRQLLKNTEKTQ